MTWATGTSDAPRLYTYQEALAHEAKVVPIRGRTPECKPLGRRDCTGLTIRKEKRSVVVSFWSTTITYRPNGLIEVAFVYAPCTSQQTLLRSLLGLAVFKSGGLVYISAYKSEEEVNGPGVVYPMSEKDLDKGQRYPRRQYKSVLRPVEKDPAAGRYGHKYRYVRADKIKYPVKKSIYRQGAASVRARYNTFLTMLSGYIKLRGTIDIKTSAPFQRANLPTAKTPGVKEMLTGPSEGYMDAIEAIAHGHRDYNWRTSTYRFYARKAQAFAQNLVYQLHANEVYKYVPVTDGTVVKNK